MSDIRQQTDDQPASFLQQMLSPRGRRYANQPFDVSSRHSIRVVSETDAGAAISEAEQFAVVDCFYHAGNYWRARIPLDGVRCVMGQAFNFSKPKTKPGTGGPEIIFDDRGLPRRKLPFLNHVQSRFSFAADCPIELFPLHAATDAEPHRRVDDMVYSVEAVGPMGVRFNLRDALCGNLISAHRIMSTEEMVFERIVVENMYVTESPPLPLSVETRRAALIASLLRSHRAGMSETYYLYRCFGTNNCTTAPLREIDRIADYTPLQRLGSALYRFPINPRFYLRIRGLDSDPSVRQLVRNEFSDYISAPSTVQRKRAHVRARTRALRAAKGRVGRQV